jgi:hypothetical protein
MFANEHIECCRELSDVVLTAAAALTVSELHLELFEHLLIHKCLDKLLISLEVGLEDYQTADLVLVLLENAERLVLKKLLLFGYQVGHDSLVKSLDSLLLFLKKAQISHYLEGFLELRNQGDEIIEAVVANVLFYFSYSIFEVFNFLRHNSTFGNSSINFFKFKIFISQNMISLGFNLGYASHHMFLIFHVLNFVK